MDAGGSKERAKAKGGGQSVVEAYHIVARKLLGKDRSRSRMTVADQEQAMEALGETGLGDDEQLLASGNVVEIDERMALEYRIGVKRAWNKLSGY